MSNHAKRLPDRRPEDLRCYPVRPMRALLDELTGGVGGHRLRYRGVDAVLIAGCGWRSIW